MMKALMILLLLILAACSTNYPIGARADWAEVMEQLRERDDGCEYVIARGGNEADLDIWSSCESPADVVDVLHEWEKNATCGDCLHSENTTWCALCGNGTQQYFLEMK